MFVTYPRLSDFIAQCADVQARSNRKRAAAPWLALRDTLIAVTAATAAAVPAGVALHDLLLPDAPKAPAVSSSSYSQPR